jgi:hypothetical protein
MKKYEHDYKVGDQAWIFLDNHKGERSCGTVVAVLDLPGYSCNHYVVEVPTEIDPLLEVRDSFCMLPEDPKIQDITYLLKDRHGIPEIAAHSMALEILEIIEG